LKVLTAPGSAGGLSRGDRDADSKPPAEPGACRIFGHPQLSQNQSRLPLLKPTLAKLPISLHICGDRARLAEHSVPAQRCRSRPQALDFVLASYPSTMCESIPDFRASDRMH